ncbi:MAG: ATP-dependent zinc metalloprotease FtsH [Dehalococcoidales bacterium]|nr:ATP-dependent zinc metalloprotease FtsH [Dehalococcoidales bacterium]
MKPKFRIRGLSLIYLLILICGIVLFAWLARTPGTAPQEIPISQVVTMSQNREIKKITDNGQWMDITTQDGTLLKSYKGDVSIFDITGLDLNNLEYNMEPASIDWFTILFTWGPILLFGVLLFLMFFRARGVNNQAISFGRSNARLFPGDKPQVTFNDVAGVDEAKQELHEVVDFLKTRERFTSLGARIPRGILLVGPPGTGKTLLARAIAGEAGVPFFSISGSEFVEMFVGVGASRVRDLFEQAKRHSPCIIFIDEIDAVGRHRGAGLGGSHDEREQTLNQILTEMDGFDTNVNVIVLAATNRPDILDPALLRPGRFDRRVVLDLPDVNGRAAILKVHTKNKPLAPAVNLETLAKETAGFSGADLANLVNEAAILAARQGQKNIEMKELEESIDKVIAGPERRSKRISPKEKEITAYHEAGHALAAQMLPNADKPHKISIIPRGMMGGYTKTLQEDREFWSRSKLLDEIAVLLAGHSSEKLIFDDVTTGAQSDIKRATGIARKMVIDFGMSDKLGPRSFGDKQEMVFLGREIAEQKDYSDKTADAIDKEIDGIIRSAYEVATKILTDNKDKLVQLTETLIVRETLETEELEALFKGEPLPPPKSAAISSPGTKSPEAKSTQSAEGTVLKPRPATGGSTV